MDVDQNTFIPGRNKLSAGETLAPDLTAYELLHQVGSTWPCLSIDLIRDNLGDNRKTYPATVYAVAGTQADRSREKENQLMVMKLSSLSRMEKASGEASDSDDEDSDDENSDPILETRTIQLNSCTNRIRATQIPDTGSSTTFPTTLTASMLENGQVLIHDITQHLTSFDTPGTTITPTQNKPVSTIRMHKANEGYALDWSPLIPGKLVTGDTAGNIFLTTRNSGGGWVTDSTPFTGHQGSVEELQWAPTDKNVFASASSDGYVKMWDVRSKSHKAQHSVRVSNTDVNVLSWSKLTPWLLASGHEDGEFCIWDLRHWKTLDPNSTSLLPASTAAASFSFHKEQITCLEWHPTDDSILMCAAGDNTVTLWDLSVELDDEESRDTAGVRDVPPQLLFVHYMEGVKEGHWHPQMPGTVMATGGAGFG
jgi:ribosome assembly protein RRB1